MYYPANAAMKSNMIDNYYCSSDDDKILSISKSLGYTPIKRPKKLALPTSKHIDSIMHGLEIMKINNDLPEILIVILANNITIKSSWINQCIKLMIEDNSIDSVVPVYKDNDHHPLRSKILDDNGYLSTYEKNVSNNISTNRQELSTCYFLSHNFWVLSVDYLMSSKQNGQPPWSFMGDKIIPYKVEESIDIHHEIDLHTAKFWIKNNYND